MNEAMTQILIADDEPLQRLLIRETLAEDDSLTFVEVANGIQALDQVRRERPDLIILDVMMPKMDGFQVCRLIKADPVLQTIPIILVTALNKGTDRSSGMDAGADDFISKPFEEDQLLAVVRNALSRVN